MARYRVRELSYFDRLYEPGEEVEYSGIAGSNLELIETSKAAIAKVNTDAKATLVEEAKQLKAVVIGPDGKPTDKPIDGSEDLETIQAAIAAMKQLRTD